MLQTPNFWNGVEESVRRSGGAEDNVRRAPERLLVATVRDENEGELEFDVTIFLDERKERVFFFF